MDKPRNNFDLMTPEKRREACAKGGRAIPAEKRAFSVDRELARAAALKGLAKRYGKGKKKMAREVNPIVQIVVTRRPEGGWKVALFSAKCCEETIDFDSALDAGGFVTRRLPRMQAPCKVDVTAA